MGRHQIVVWIDGSPGSTAALTWALGAAQPNSSVVTLLHAYRLDTIRRKRIGRPLPRGFSDAVDVNTWSAAELEEAERALNEIEAGLDIPAGVDVITRAVEGKPATVLIDASRTADLVVIGAGDPRGLTRRLSASLADQCFGRVSCPMVVVPEPAASEQPPTTC